MSSEVKQEVAVFEAPRLPYHPAIEKEFGITKGQWKVLTDAIFPAAKSSDAITLALSYCKARNLDPMKRVVHIVPVWDSSKGKMVETVWPGIADHRITAFRTGSYAGREETKFGADITAKIGHKEMTFPQWAQVTLYRVINGDKVSFAGPKVWWKETYSQAKRDDPSPNDRWARAPYGQIEKCAEAAALRAAFPEELGGESTVEEMEGKSINEMVDVTPKEDAPPPKNAEDKLAAFEEKVPEPTAELPLEEAPNFDPETGEILPVKKVGKK